MKSRADAVRAEGENDSDYGRSVVHVSDKVTLRVDHVHVGKASRRAAKTSELTHYISDD
jgi:hypothetical protein